MFTVTCSQIILPSVSFLYKSFGPLTWKLKSVNRFWGNAVAHHFSCIQVSKKKTCQQVETKAYFTIYLNNLLVLEHNTNYFICPANVCLKGETKITKLQLPKRFTGYINRWKFFPSTFSWLSENTVKDQHHSTNLSTFLLFKEDFQADFVRSWLSIKAKFRFISLCQFLHINPRCGIHLSFQVLWARAAWSQGREEKETSRKYRSN